MFWNADTVENSTRGAAVVTGGGSGVGRAVALALVADGWAVTVAGRRREPLEETARAAPGGSVDVVVADVRDPEAVRTLFADIGRRGAARVDLLFNNAGVSGAGRPLTEVTPDEWRNVVDTNVNGMFWCAQAAFAAMRDQQPRGGRIINNGSISAHVPRPNSIAYTTTKHAVTGLTRALALEGRAFDIAVGQIDIGNAGTEMTSAMASGVLQADGSTRVEPTMDVADAARVVTAMAALPLGANVQFATVMATAMPYIGRG